MTQKDSYRDSAFDASENERTRLKVLENYRIWNADLKDELNGLVSLACNICDTPISLVNILNEHTQLTKAGKGWNLEKISRESSFCQYTILDDDIMIVENTETDERFRESPFVKKDPNIRFYAGMPLTTSKGHNLGVLCVIDNKPRKLTDKQKQSLRVLADEVVARFDLVKNQAQLKKRNKELEKATMFIKNSSDIQAIIDAETLRILEVNDETMELLECEREDLVGGPFGNSIADEKIKKSVKQFLTEKKETHRSFVGPVKTKSGNKIYLDHIFTFRNGLWYLTAKDVTNREEAKKALVEEKIFSDAILDNLPGVFCLANIAGTLIRWNKNFEALTGLSSEEIKETPLLNYFSADDPGSLASAVKSVFTKGHAETEGYLKTKSGEKIPYLLTGFRFKTSEDTYLAGIGVDITEQRKAEDKLQKALDSLSKAQEIASLGSWELDLEAGTQQWSDEACRILGYDPEHHEAGMEQLMKAVHPDDREKVEEDIQALSQGKNHIDTEHRVISQDGSRTLKYVIERGKAEYDEQGEITKISGTVQDITERKRAEQELEKRSQAIMASIDGIAILDEKNNFTFMNEAHARIYGYTKEELTGTRWEPLYSAKERKRFKSIVDSLLNDRQQWRGEARGNRKDGSQFPIEISLSKINSGGTVCIVRDITDRKETLRELKETRIEKNTILKSASDCIITINHEGNIIGFNDAAENVFAYTRDEVIGKSLNETIIPRRHRAGHVNGMKHFIDTGEGPVMGRLLEMPAIRKDGTEFPVELKVNKIEDTDPPIYMGILRDISERKKYEKALISEKKRFQIATQAISDVVWDWDFGKNKIWWSEGLKTVFGYDDYEAASDPDWWEQQIHPNDREKAEKSIQDFLESDETFWSLSYRFTMQDGSVAYIEEDGYALRDDMGNPTRMIGAMKNVTPQTLARKRLEQEKKLSDKIINSLPINFFMFDDEGNAVRWNDNLRKTTGYTEQEIAYLSPLDYFPENEQKHIKQKITEVFKEGQATTEGTLKSKDGTGTPYLLSASIFQSEGNAFMIGTGQDISAQKRSQHQLRKSLNEKEVLLSEIHHRVKNNLAIISGLLQLEGFKADNSHTEKVLKNSQLRIQSMATIHEMLYQANDLNNLSFHDFIAKIIEAIQGVYDKNHKDIRFNFHTGSIQLNVNQAIPCALIINELVTNAYKHAFLDEQTGSIEISLREQNNQILIRVKDEGKGLPDDFSIEEIESLGFTLIKILVQQLNAGITIDSTNGTDIMITFEKKNQKGSGSSLRIS